MSKFLIQSYLWLNDLRVKLLLKILILLALLLLSQHVYAQNNTDMLQGDDASAWATLNGTGKKFIYLIEGIAAIAGYIKSKNLLTFTGIVVIAVFINILISMAGGQS